ncbi:MAG TPA: tetratricopeptide repeat protein [Verrucomicrobiae bacterium]|nr:tetratricopeptide repeat protein [Verrucomicrobiae bacterium]
MLTIKNGDSKNGKWLMNSSFSCGCRAFSFFISFAFALVLSGCKPPGPKALWEGKYLIDRGEYTEAVDKLKTATSLLSTNALAWNYLGLAYHRAGQPNDAADAYRKALALDQNLVEVHYDLGCLWLEQNRPDLAKGEFTAYTLHRGDKSPEGWIKLGEAQMRMHDLVSAEKSLNQARQSDAQNPEALNDLGVIQVQHNHAPEAAQFFNGALRTKPDYSPAILNLAIVSEQYLNSRPNALKHYQDYLALQPKPANWDAVDAAVRALQGESHPAQVITPARPVPSNTVTQSSPVSNSPRQTASVSPRTVAPRQETATNPRTSTPPQSSQTEVVQLQPEPTMHAAQDSGSFTSEQPSGGSAQTGAIAESPKDKHGSFLSRVNPVNLFRGNSKTSPAPETTQIASANPEPTPVTFPRYSYHRVRKPAEGNRGEAEKAFDAGSQAQQAGQLSQAIQYYRQATEADPGYFDPYYNLGVVCVRSGNLADALQAYETALVIQPGSHDARFNFALALKQNNYPIDAANELEKLLAKFPNDASAHYALGSLYAQQLRQPTKARLHYEKVLELDPGLPQAAAVHDWLWSHPH